MDGKLRLCDFGSCVEGNIPISTATGRQDAEEIIQKETTQMYRAPEMVDLYMRPVLTEKTDIWALGCILYALCFLKHPIQDAGPLGILSAKIVFPANSTFSADTHAFILKMLDVDPEARLSVAQCLECTAALASNRPLPDFPLSAEAAQRRAERIAANELRQSKQKKVVVAAPRKVVAPLDSNSVAARRLAAKRGGTSGANTPGTDLFGDNSSPRVNNTRQESSKSPEFAVDFDAFPSQESNSNSNSSAAFSSKSQGNQFADFDDAPIKAASNTISNANSLFDDDDEEDVHSAAPAAPVQAFSSSSKSSGHTFDAFESDAASTATFDAFAPTSAVAAVAASNVSAKSNHGATFDAFDNDSAALVDFGDAPPATAAAPVSSSFSSFDDHASSFVPSTDAFASSASAGGLSHDPFGSAPLPPAVPVKPAKPFNRRSSFATAAPIAAPVEAFDLLDVDDVSEPPPRLSASHSHSIEFDLFTEPVDSTSSIVGGRASFSAPPSSSATQQPNFGDDVLIPQQATTPHQSYDPYQQQQHQPTQRRSVSSKDPHSVLSLFDQPAPEKPPKPVMLNTPANMMGVGPMGGGGGPRGGPMAPNRGMVGPMGGQGGGMMSPGMQHQQFSPGGVMGGGPMSGGRTPGGQQQQQQQGGFYSSPAPSPHQHQQQQQFTPGAQRTMQSAAYPVIQTNKTVDPFDSINHYGGNSGSGRR
eukprot:gene21833-27904_t